MGARAGLCQRRVLHAPHEPDRPRPAWLAPRPFSVDMDAQPRLRESPPARRAYLVVAAFVAVFAGGAAGGGPAPSAPEYIHA